MTLTIYGPAQSRAGRALWMAEEIKAANGTGYEHVADVFGEDGASAQLLALNPMGQVPVIDDEGLHLPESMAINLYLAKKHGVLAPGSLEEEAQTLRWCFWAMMAVESTLLEVLFAARGLAGHDEDPEAAAAGIEKLQKPLGVLDAALAGTEYLVGDQFSVADLNVAAVLSWTAMAGVDLAPFPNLAGWLERCLGREAFAKAQG